MDELALLRLRIQALEEENRLLKQTLVGKDVERDKTEERLHEYISNEAYKSHGREAAP